MITQVIVNMDSALKEKAMKKAKKQGLPFSAVINMATKAFVEDRFNVEVVEELNEKTKRSLRRAINDIKLGRGLSPVFHTVEEARKYLES